MRYIVHVIDEASAHKKDNSGEYSICYAELESQGQCQIARSDSFYVVSAETPMDAVVSIAGIARVKDSNGKLISLAKSFAKTKKEVENASIDEDEFVVLNDSPFEYGDNTTSKLFVASCQIKKEDENEKWSELHRVYFYVLPEKKILQIVEEKDLDE